jgi:aspartyl/asparaginyl-tRNA synthetase
MQTTFNDLVNNVRKLSLTEKLEIKNIVEKSIIDEQRDEIHESYLKSLKEHKENKLQFSNDINQLKKMID